MRGIAEHRRIMASLQREEEKKQSSRPGSDLLHDPTSFLRATQPFKDFQFFHGMANHLSKHEAINITELKAEC
jgi:hypothetical protein